MGTYKSVALRWAPGIDAFMQCSICPCKVAVWLINEELGPLFAQFAVTTFIERALLHFLMFCLNRRSCGAEPGTCTTEGQVDQEAEQ